MSEDPVEKKENTEEAREKNPPVDRKPEIATTAEVPVVSPTTERLASLKVSLATLKADEKEQPPEITAVPKPADADLPKYERHYAEIAETRYNSGPLAGHGEALIKEVGEIPPSSSVIEVGCNTGMFLNQWKAATGSDIVGFDINADAVAEARQRGYNANVAPAENLPLQDDLVDIITSLHTYEHVQDLPKSLEEIARVLKPGGKAVIIEPPNLYGLETLRVAIEDMPENMKGNGPFGFVRTYVNGLKYARELHRSILGGPLGGARAHAEKILKQGGINLKVRGGMRADLAFANLLVFEKPAQP